MKICTRCHAEKEETEYYKRSDQLGALASHCKKCQALYTKESRARPDVQRRMRKTNKEYRRKKKRDKKDINSWLAKKYESIPCMDCEKLWPWCAMDFDHRPEEVKGFSVSSRGNYLANPENISNIMKEVAKCDLVCASCHRVRTYISRS